MPKFTIHLMHPYMTWEGVEAASEEEALKKVDFPPEADLADGPWDWKVEEEEEEEE